MKKLFLLLLLSLSGCERFNRDPEPTEAGWVLFRYAEESLALNRQVVMQSAWFDLYYRAQSEDERREFEDCYFPRERIVQQDDRWLILSTYNTWIYELQDGRSLRDEDALWRITWRYEGTGEEIAATIRSSADGSLLYESRIDTPDFDTQTELGFRITYDRELNGSLWFHSGGGMLRGKDTPRLDLAFTIGQTVIFPDWSEYPLPGGTLSLTAHNEADGADELVTGRYLANDEVEIDYLGKTGVWNRNPVPEYE